MARVVLVTGVSRYLGGRMARLLTDDPEVERVIGVDVVTPTGDIGGADFVRADIRNPIIGKVISTAGVDTVVHMGVIATPRQAGGRTPMKEINVIGTMQLLAACQKASSVEKLVVKSSTSVYGAGAADAAMLSEDMEPTSLPTSGWAKDSVEVESYVRGLARRRPDLTVTTLRFANFLGPTANTPMAQYFSLPVIPTVLGYDARLQFVHEDDGLEVLRRATVEDHAGTYNVAGDGVLALSQAIRRAGRVGVPVWSPLVGVVGRWVRRGGFADFSPEQIRLLTHGRAVDTTRLQRAVRLHPAVQHRRDLRRLRPCPAAEQRDHPRAGHGRGDGGRAHPVRVVGVNDARVLRMPGADEPSGTDVAVIGEGPSWAEQVGERPGVPAPPRPGPVRGRRVRLRSRASTTASCWPRCARSTGTGSGSRSAGSRTCRPRAGPWWWPTTRARSAWTPSWCRWRSTTPIRTSRHLRPLGADIVFDMPFVGMLARKAGATLACNADAERLLRSGELVGVWPEGYKGTGKPFSERYRLQRFGRGGFVSAALQDRGPDRALLGGGVRGDLPDAGQRQGAGPHVRAALLPHHPDLPVAGPAGHGAAALEVGHRVR